MSIFTRFSAWLGALRGGQAFAVCFVSGAVMALGFAPVHAWPMIFISLPVFYRLLCTATKIWQAAWRGFFFGYGYFMAGTWWIANAMLVDVSKFAWMIPFSVLGLSALLAVWFGLFGALAFRLRSASVVRNVVRFAGLWVAVEYLRSVGMFGFPWNLAGYIALPSLHIAQVASVMGTYGLGFFVVLAGLAPMVMVRHRRAGMLPLLVMGGFYAYGVWRIPPSTAMTDTHLRIVQANIAQSLKWTPQGGEESLDSHAQLTRAPGTPPDVAIWSETAFPFTLREDSMWPYRLAQLLPPQGVLLTGAVRSENRNGMHQIWNSMVAIDAQGRMRDRYDKHQLVPFGEFMPLRDVLPLDKITPGDIDFSRGAGPRTLIVNERVPPFSPLICYEAIFPWAAVNPQQRPQWMVNITNDAWYGNSPGPYQHFDMARMRAIEQGLPLARAANTGISAVVDPYGRVVASLGLEGRGVVDSLLPTALPATIYSRMGEWLVIFILLLFTIFTFFPLNVTKNK
jgi:apolipoprotein N-acyltransferase